MSHAFLSPTQFGHERTSVSVRTGKGKSLDQEERVHIFGTGKLSCFFLIRENTTKSRDLGMSDLW